MKSKTINQTGIVVKGTATLNLWGGGQGDIQMDETYLPNDKITPKNILRCVNDGGFGCQSIESADIEIYIKYDNGCTEYDRSIYVDHPIHVSYFLGWRELREQGVKI